LAGERQSKGERKSLLGVLSLAISDGDTITILSDGDDEENAVNVLCDMLEELGKE